MKSTKTFKMFCNKVAYIITLQQKKKIINKEKFTRNLISIQTNYN